MPFDQPVARSPVTTHSLADASVGSEVRIASVAAGSGLVRRLTELGLPRGAEVTVVGRMGRRGAMILSAHGTRLVIGHDMAAAITVSSVVH